MTPLLAAVVVGAVGASALIYGAVRGFLSGDGQFGYVEGIVGRIGQGKTTIGVLRVYDEARVLGAVVLSNVPLMLDGVQSETIPLGWDGLDMGWLLDRIAELRAQGRSIVVFVDEASLVLSSRNWQTFGPALMFCIQQSRKLGMRFFFTAQSFSFVDTQLRQVTSVVRVMTAIPPATLRRRRAGKRPIWLVETSYEPGDETLKRGKSVQRRILRYPRRAEGMFDTDALILPPQKLKGSELVYSAFSRENADPKGWS